MIRRGPARVSRALGLAFLVSMLVGLARPGAAAVESGALSVSMLGRPIGQESYALESGREGTVLTSELDLVERGGSLQVRSRLELGADLAPRRFRSSGNTYRFVAVDLDWEATRSETPGPIFPSGGYAPLAGRALLVRYWEAIGRPARIGVVPDAAGRAGRQATIEWRGSDTLNVGGRETRLSRYSVSGIVWGRETVWLDEQGRLAALLTRIHILPLEAVREELRGLLPLLQASALRDRMADLERAAAESAPVASGEFAIVGARLIDGTGRPPLEDSLVVVRDGRIAAAGPRLEPGVPPGVPRIDGRGKTVAPGLWDMHAHASQIEWAPAYLAAGVTSIRDMGGETRFLIAVRDAVASGRAVGPRIFLAGLVDGESPQAMGAVTAATPEQGREVVEAYAAAGFSQIKLYPMLQPEVIAAVVARAHELGLTVTGHVPNAVSLREAIGLGMDQIAHLPLEGDPESAANRELVRLLARHRVVIDPTLPWNELLGRAPGTVIESFEPGFLRTPAALALAYQSVRNATDPAGADASRRSAGAMVKALHDAGAPIVAGTDGAVPGVSLLRALELYVEAGLTPMEAIQTATSVAARALGADGESGTIEAGRRADLIVLDADPLADISNIRRLRWVVAAGRMYEPAVFERQRDGL